MSASPPDGFGSPGPLRVSELLGIFPEVADLQPFLDLLVARSVADPGRRWTGSGELGTVGDRLVDSASAREAASTLEASEAERLAALLGTAAQLVEAVAAGEWSRAADLLIEQGGADEERGRYRDAEAWYLAAHRLARDRGSTVAPQALRLAARAARAVGDLDAAALRYEEAWHAASDMDLEQDEIVAATGRGNVEVDRGRWSAAAVWYERALERIGSSGPPRRERWQIYQNLGIVRRSTGDLIGAREALVRAREEGARLSDPDAAVEVENGWGQLLLAEGDARAAELHFAEALRGARTPTARVAIGVNLGESLLLQGRSLEAGERAREAEAEALAGSVTARLPEIYRLLAKVARERREAEAFMPLRRALDLIRERGLPRYEEALTREALGSSSLDEGSVDAGVAELCSAAEIYREIGMESAFERLMETVREHGGSAGEPSDQREV